MRRLWQVFLRDQGQLLGLDRSRPRILRRVELEDSLQLTPFLSSLSSLGFDQIMNTRSFQFDVTQHVFELMLVPCMRAFNRLTNLPEQIFPYGAFEMVAEVARDGLRHLIFRFYDTRVIDGTLRLCGPNSNPSTRGKKSRITSHPCRSFVHGEH